MKPACKNCKHWLPGIDIESESLMWPSDSYGWCSSGHASNNFTLIQGKKNKGPTGLETRADAFCKFFLHVPMPKAAE